MQKALEFSSTRYEKCFAFFDKMRKVFTFLTRCEKCVNFFDNMQKFFIFLTKSEKCFNFFDKIQKRRLGQGCSLSCRAGGVTVPEKPSSLSVVMCFSDDPASSQGNRKRSTG